MDSFSNDLSYLLVSEYVRFMQKHFEGKNDEQLHVETQVYQLGLKPGFAFAAQLCYDGDNVTSESEAGKFISTVLSPKLFGTRARYDFSNKVLTFAYKTLPITIKCLTSPDGSFSPEQLFWYRCHTSFISGVFAGALSHFGYKVLSYIEPVSPQSNGQELIFKFTLEPLEGAWTFCSTMHHTSSHD